MAIFILVLHITAALGIVGLVLLQQGKGADVGAAFGSGSAGSVFGASGSANFLSRATGVLALVFFLTSLALTYFSTRKPDTDGVMMNAPMTAPSLPAQVPGQGTTPAIPPQGDGAAVPQASSLPVPMAPSEAGRVQEVPK